MALSNDSPIDKPTEDLFGLDPYARAIAHSIEAMQAPTGIVLAINGSWGSGKSSAVNLIRHHLSPSIAAGVVVPVTFNPWWFAGEETLALAFFQQLNITIGPSLPQRLRKSLMAMGRGVSAAGALLATVADLKLPGAGGIISSVTGLFGKLGDSSKSVEQEHKQVADALASQSKRFLVVIDDIDRLNPDDALTIFRLVKSVGRLPNVIYLLAFDRELAERLVSERFPSEGASYLDKIVQTSFDLPPPQVDVLRRQLLSAAVEIFGEPSEEDMVRFMNLFYDVVAPVVHTPRDVVRLANNLTTTWPAVARDVDRADFFAMAAIRLAMPKIFHAIRDHPNELCGLQNQERSAGGPELYDQLLQLHELPARQKEQMRRALRRLFPRLDGVWSNMFYSDERDWRRRRLICSMPHFHSYFAFAISENVMPAAETDEFLSRAGQPDFVRQTLLENLQRQRRDGTSRTSLLLDELSIHAPDVGAPDVPNLVNTLFELGDVLHVESDELRGFGIGSNQLRLHWILNRLVNERYDEAGRAGIYTPAMANASLGWACDFAERCLAYFQPREGRGNIGPAIVAENVANEYRGIALGKLRRAAGDGTLIAHGRLVTLLFDWSRLSDEGVPEVRRWTDSQLANDDFIVAMAGVMVSVSYTQGLGLDGMGDRVARPVARLNAETYRDVVDFAAIEQRVGELLTRPELTEAQRERLSTFHDAQRVRGR